MRRFLSLTALLLATACGGSDQRETRTESQDLKTYDITEDASAPTTPPAPAAMRSSGPDIALTAAPGVAFNYRYAFRLPTERVRGVQEQHAQACEKLGLARCRITGLRYRVVNERDIDGMLAFKLDPAIARAFGEAGVKAVEQAEGMLIDNEVSGVDAGASIKSANRTDAQLSDDLRRIEGELARPGLRSEERARLQSEAQALRDRIRATRATREEQEESLATTPVVFQYGSGDLVPGFNTRAPVRDALQRAGDNFIGSLTWLFVAVVTLLPWALLLLLGLWVARRLRRYFAPAPQPEVIAGDAV